MHPLKKMARLKIYPAQSFDRIMAVNVKGIVHCCQVIGGQMAKEERGSIINICSIYGVVSPDQRIYEYRKKSGLPFYKPVAYSVSKSALLNLSRYLATYWAEKNVHVNTLTFGGVFNNQDKKFLKGYCNHVPLGRMAREDEYNGAVPVSPIRCIIVYDRIKPCYRWGMDRMVIRSIEMVKKRSHGER